MFILYLVGFRLLSGHLFGKWLLTRLIICSFVFCLFVILVFSRFGSEGWILTLIASDPDLCILFTFIIRVLVVVPCGGPQKVSPHVNFMFLFFQSSGVVYNYFPQFLSLDAIPIRYCIEGHELIYICIPLFNWCYYICAHFAKNRLGLSYTCAHKSGAFALSFGVTLAPTYSQLFLDQLLVFEPRCK